MPDSTIDLHFGLVSKSLEDLEQFCIQEDFKGWDPYDGLNSILFQATPLKNWSLARLAWIQLFKRSPLNFRKIVGVSRGYNPKGIALFLTGYCNLYRVRPKPEYLDKIKSLAQLLISLQTPGFSGACWGYNFDWQVRKLFLFPAGTPTVVATTFAATALMQAYEVTHIESYLESALSSANFIIKDLGRTKKKRGFLFSYSPISGNNTVYNASLMGSKLLSHCYKYKGKYEFVELAHESVMACVDAQNQDGSWVYGELSTQNWIDSFHTGYNLECLQEYSILCNSHQYDEVIKIGLDFYLNNFFMYDGTPKYYHDRLFPIDIHCPAQLFVTLSKLNCFKEHRIIANKVMHWTIKHMQDKNGYFYYQKSKYYTIKIPYMRWSQAFMFYGMSNFIKAHSKIESK